MRAHHLGLMVSLAQAALVGASPHIIETPSGKTWWEDEMDRMAEEPPKPKELRRPHQGAKECARRLKRMAKRV